MVKCNPVKGLPLEYKLCVPNVVSYSREEHDFCEKIG